MERLQCPYCEHTFDVEYEDLLWNDGDEKDFECPKCTKEFVVQTSTTVHFHCEEKDEE